MYEEPAVLSVTGGGSTHNWNCTNKDREDYSTKITGDVVAIHTPQKINFNTKQPEFWPDGKPVLNVALVIATKDGEKDWVFSPGSKTKRTNAWNAVIKAIESQGITATTISQIGGFNITVATQEPPEGFGYGQGHPRPFAVRVNGEATQPFRGWEEVGAQHTAAPATPVDDFADDEFEF